MASSFDPNRKGALTEKKFDKTSQPTMNINATEVDDNDPF
jgi:hypothetical protein